MFNFFKELLPRTRVQFTISTLFTLMQFSNTEFVKRKLYNTHLSEICGPLSDELLQQARSLVPTDRNTDYELEIQTIFICVFTFSSINILWNFTRDEIRKERLEAQLNVETQPTLNIPTDNQDAYDQLNNNKTIPDKYLCPITRQIINQPYKLSGHYYEANALFNYFSTHGFSVDPLTRLELPQAQIDAIKKDIKDNK